MYSNFFMRSLGKTYVMCIALLLMSFTSCKKDDKVVDLSAELLNTKDLIKEIIEEINTNYADEIAREKLEIGAINGILSTLDEHSVYISKDDVSAFNQSARGSFLGIGIEIKKTQHGIEILSVIDDSPAAKVDLKVFDVIEEIDGKHVSNMTLKEVINKLCSDIALNIDLSIIRNKTEKFKVTIKKNVIKLQSVKLDFIEDIAILKINYFNEGTVTSVTNAIKKLNKKKAKAVILDLRNNPGGILEQAIGVSDLFLSSKKIIEFKSRNISDSREIFADETDLLNDKPMVVLINANTASGGELVASALGENKRAVLIGEKTYGKGSLQTLIPIPGHGAIKLTTAYFFSPNGNPINKAGISPDIEIKKTDNLEGKDIIIQRAVDLLHGLSAVGGQS